MQPATDEHLKLYDAHIRRKRTVLVLSAAATLLIAVFAVGVGSYTIPAPDVIRTLLGQGSAEASTVIFGIRLPRVAAAVVVGASLAVAGAVMQCVLQNPLASATTLGVAQGAAFGAAVGIIVFDSGVVAPDAAVSGVSINNPYIVTFSAFVFGSLSTVVVVLLSRLKPDLGPGGIVLAGVALGALFSAGSMLLQYFADAAKISAVVFWTFGNLGSASWLEIGILGGVFAAAFIYFLQNRWNYNAMEAGADTAMSLGVNTRSVMLIGMAVATLLSAIAVSFVGIIGFIGLVAPHIMRRFVGNDYRYLIPASALTGALLLIAADTFARLIIAPVILPIGAITSLLGAPVFLVLLFRGFGSRD